jgi:hypothetical protein
MLPMGEPLATLVGAMPFDGLIKIFTRQTL